MAKKAKTEVKKSTDSAINLRQIGQNILVTIDNKDYSKRFPNRANREVLKGKVEAYNKRPSKAKLKEIVDIMAGGKTTEEERKATVKAGKVEEKPKVADNKAKNEEIERAKKLLMQEGYIISQQAPRQPVRRSGEH